MPFKTRGAGQNAEVTGLNFYTSNQLEKLAARLAATLDSRAGTPFAPDIVVVQSRGMARWVSLQVAEANGICMNCGFPFPRAFVEETLRAFFPEMADPAEFSPGAMAWKIHALLPGLARKKELTPVRNYLAGDEGVKSFQLAEKIARLFDQYLVYRPEMLLRWERDTGEKEWQAVVWRELAGKRGTMHLAAVNELLGERMAQPLQSELPERVSIFGVATLPPLYLRVFFELARHCEVNFFSLQPSMEYHGHDVAPRVAAKRAVSAGARAAGATGNELLSSLGRLNRDFTELRLEIDERAGFVTREQPEDFVEPGNGSMLAVIQADILHARDRGGAETPKIKVAAGDRSIQVHDCHSPMREIEVLQDQLLDLFENDATLRPRDIIVMAPDIEKYAPFIHAVFGCPEEQARFIPFSVADRAPRSENPAVAAFLALLALPGSRCTATEIFSLLDSPPLRARFGFGDGEMAQIRAWIAASGIRWGIDGAHRGEFGVPEVEETTWRAGFERLLLGCAMAGGNRAVFEGIVPCDEVEGTDTEAMGRFIAAATALFETAAELPKERPLAEWPGVLRGMLARFFSAGTTAEAAGLRFLQTALDEFEQAARAAGAAGSVDFGAVREYLGGVLGEGEQRGGFFTGGVTFCALKPMRSIPARVICLIGMGDEAFPRRVNAPGFDLMARKRETGDRSPRDDDRLSFLEAIISARDHLYISHAGRSVIDNAEVPPSVVVSELLDCMDRSFEFAGGKDACGAVVRPHRLHAFSRRYFDGSDADFFSYSAANAAASRNLAEPQSAEHRLPELPLAEPDAATRNVELRSLVEFFSHPAKFFTRRRLGIRFDEAEEALEENEVFDPGNLELYKVKQELLADAMEGRGVRAAEFAARGMLPPGGAGEARFQMLCGAAGEFFAALEPELRGVRAGGHMEVDFPAGEFSLTGRIDSLHAGRIVQFRCAKLKPKDWLRVWIHHLVKCASSPGACAESVLAGEDVTVKFAPVADAARLLAKLLEIYRAGLRQPPPFFSLSSFAYALETVHPRPRGRTPPIGRARIFWNGTEWADGEKDDVYNKLYFASEDALDNAFERLAMEILGPMLENATPP